ncbi:MAG TPA: hypothetical protein VLS87_05100 [Woeseiaceae bacterium]|nr:hypothetical protein [Woeseiaceae bacterium]
MPRKKVNNGERARLMVAQEAARIIVNQGIRDFGVAKTKAAERLGLRERGSLPGNVEIEHAVSEHLQLFAGDSHTDLLHSMRQAALSAMELLSPFMPRLVGPVLSGTADANSAVNLHVFADSVEAVADALDRHGFNYKPYERRLKSRRDRTETYAGFEFHHGEAAVQATVFPVDGLRQAPISPVDGKPMKRADEKAVRELLRDV